MYIDTRIRADAPPTLQPVPDSISGEADGDAYSPPEGRAARWGRWASQALVIGLVLMMGVEMLVRSVFGWSIQFSNELGGYALVAITFLSLASGQLLHAYHSVHFLENRLGPRGQARLKLLFDLLATAVTLVLLVELARFEWLSWKSGDVAATTLMTPLWLPRLAMPLGVLVLAWALLRIVAADVRRLRAVSR
ncbi:TRAP transporter small permease subunit [Bordetella petrii]|uniref:TRAP transporter small permease subunit n=1 Tax=Bordetella petrii TaxID=94624 RepID=UPI001E369286|nr:TRAP transporter small permease [Bordetella petrii]MCD0502178.1 TRAP transporter small permease [Bordetella petrii]